MSQDQWGQVSTNVQVTIYAQPDTSSAVVGTFMPGLVLVALSDPAQPWIQLEEAVIDYSQPDTAIVTPIGWVSQAEAAQQGGAITPLSTAHLPPGPMTPFAGQGIVTGIEGVFSSLANALPSFGSGLLVVIGIAAFLAFGRARKAV